MPQVSLYLEDGVLDESQARAADEGIPLSRYVNRALKAVMSETWPESFRRSLGSIHDESFVRPSQPPMTEVAPL
ncbi:MAG: hypothetical protein LBK95_16790 [Bifidobacteriaceae bacterium]|jgi:hypothetical protein|nr:hypothetical protein [Bifidobacteriaceae bacterium]